MKAYVIVTALLFANPAWSGEWSVKIREDVFNGKASSTLLGGVSAPVTLYLFCTTDDEKFLSVIFKPGVDGFVPGAAAKIELKLSEHLPLRLDGSASLFASGEYWGFIFAVDKSSVYKNFLNALRFSKGSLAMTLDIPSTKVHRSETISLDGAPESVAKFATACKIQNPTQ